jgi:hypothetical protein
MQTKKLTSPRTPNVEELAAQVKAELKDAWLPNIYDERVRKMRTRSYTFEGLPNKGRIEIQHTLLGVELKAGRRRMLCPDLATARYLAVFARAGCASVAVPYDITKISQMADELESSWHRMLLLADLQAAGKTESFKSRLRKFLIDKIKTEVDLVGPGTSVPEFRQNTKQRT